MAPTWRPMQRWIHALSWCQDRQGRSYQTQSQTSHCSWQWRLTSPPAFYPKVDARQSRIHVSSKRSRICQNVPRDALFFSFDLSRRIVDFPTSSHTTFLDFPIKWKRVQHDSSVNMLTAIVCWYFMRNWMACTNKNWVHCLLAHAQPHSSYLAVFDRCLVWFALLFWNGARLVMLITQGHRLIGIWIFGRWWVWCLCDGMSSFQSLHCVLSQIDERKRERRELRSIEAIVVCEKERSVFVYLCSHFLIYSLSCANYLIKPYGYMLVRYAFSCVVAVWLKDDAALGSVDGYHMDLSVVVMLKFPFADTD